MLAQSPDGRTLAVGAGDEAVLVDTATLQPRAHLLRTGLHPGPGVLAGRHHAGGERRPPDGVGHQRREPVEVLAQDGEADDPRFSRDGKTLYTMTVAGSGPGVGHGR